MLNSQVGAGGCYMPKRDRSRFEQDQPVKADGRRSYDLEERLVRFAVLVCSIVESLPSTRVGKHLAGQLIRCGTSPAANYGEAQSGESRRDFIHKLKLCLKELRETRVWLTLSQRLALSDMQALASASRESEELIRIVAKSIVTAERNA